MRTFASEQGIELFRSGDGISHQIVAERRFASPGGLVVGSDSHTCTQGGLNLFATGVGSSDMAVAMLTGQLWFKVPESIQVRLEGALRPGVYAKDVALSLTRRLGADGANWCALEFTGPGLSCLTIGDRMTICNMAIETGAKTGIFEADQVLAEWHGGEVGFPVRPDPEAVYKQVVVLDLSALEPCVAAPHAVENVLPVSELSGTVIDQALIGTCTNGRLADLEEAARILRGRRIHPRVRMFVTPASREVFEQAIASGAISTLVQAGATILTPSCAGCTGGGFCGIPADGERVITAANRNFRGRLGNPNAFLYLASPATVAASAIAGEIVDCRTYLL